MNEQAFRHWLESQPLARRSAARARRLGRPYDGPSLVLERVREFERFLAERRSGTTLDSASPEEAMAFVAEYSKTGHVSEGACRGALASYYRFAGNEEFAVALDLMGHDFLSRFVLGQKLAKRLEGSPVRTLADLLPESSSLPAASLERCYQAVVGADPARIKAFVEMLRAAARVRPDSLLELVQAIDSRSGARKVLETLGISQGQLRLILGVLDKALAAPAPKTGVELFPSATALNTGHEARYRRLHRLLASLFDTAAGDTTEQHQTAYRRRLLYGVLWLFATLGRPPGPGGRYLAMDGRRFIKERQKKNLNSWRRYFGLCTPCVKCGTCGFVAGLGVTLNAVTADGKRFREFEQGGDFELRLSFAAKAGGVEVLTALQEYAGLLQRRYGAKAASQFGRVNMDVIAA